MREHDPHGETMGADVGRSYVAPPVRGALVTLTNTPPEQHTQVYIPLKQHTPRCAHDVADVECDPIAHFQELFPRSSRVTSMGTLPITFLVDHDLVPMKFEKLPGI